MKFVAVAMLLIVHISPALAEEPYPHEYENGGYFAAQKAAPAQKMPQAEVAFEHEYENGGHFAGATLEPGSPQAAAPDYPKNN